jgi:hypothetical protein
MVPDSAVVPPESAGSFGWKKLEGWDQHLVRPDTSIPYSSGVAKKYAICICETA